MIFDTMEKYTDLLEDTMTGTLKYTLMNDFLSKYCLQNNLYALSGLVGALLHIDPESITGITVLNPVQPGQIITDKNCVLDIKIELNHHEIINIEIQSRKQDFWPERSLTYLCRNFNHLTEGDSYREVKPCIQIGILGNELFDTDDPRYTDEFFVEYELLSLTKHTGYTGKFQIKMLFLSHLENADESEKSDPNGLYYWAKLFKARTWEDLKIIAKENPRIESLVGTVRMMTAEDRIIKTCEAQRRYSIEIATYEMEVHDSLAKAEEARAQANEAQARAKEAIAQADKALARANEAEAKANEAEAKANEAEARANEAEARANEAETRVNEAETRVNETDRQNLLLQQQIDELKRKLKEI